MKKQPFSLEVIDKYNKYMYILCIRTKNKYFPVCSSFVLRKTHVSKGLLS